MASTSEAPPNSLGLDFDQLRIQDPFEIEAKSEDTAQSPSKDAESAEKKKPYVNPERVKTGGNQRDKLSEEALSERMARMREQNEKIKQRRLDVQADEEAFKKTQESERVKLAQSRKVQEGVDRTREQNAKRKMDKIQSREWDSGKPTSGADWKQRQTPKAETPVDEKSTKSETPKPETISAPSSPPPPTAHDSGGWTRGGSPRGSTRGRGGRGRGRGRGGATGAPDRSTESEAPVAPKEEAP
ncbi:hypothetical protein B0H15DRAFT_793591 [Mycena belliarum]|uniref:Uncharacterized protein n=1 Tax=Mycena belliarum TaxID=1033014 RepID=A0AAD6TLW1_9AGAR|nr:hypothetical protein B0H15DRAFT_793591 [Mycena belliae]